MDTELQMNRSYICGKKACCIITYEKHASGGANHWQRGLLQQRGCDTQRSVWSSAHPNLYTMVKGW